MGSIMGSNCSSCRSTVASQTFPDEDDVPHKKEKEQNPPSVEYHRIMPVAGDSTILSTPITSVEINQREMEVTARRQWQQAVNKNNMYVIENLAEEFDDINIAETLFENGERAVHRAIHNDNLELLVFLASLDAKMDAPDAIKRNTPLSLAIQQNRLPMIKFLTGHHQDFAFDDPSPMRTKDLLNEEGKSAVDYAALSADSRIWYLVSPEKDLSTYLPRGNTEPVQPREIPKSDEDLDGKQEADAVEQSQAVKADLTFFSGWLRKRRAASRGTKPRFIVMLGEYIGWSEKEVDPEIVNIPQNRKLFKKYYHLKDIHEIEAMDNGDGDNSWLRLRGAQTALKFIVYEFKAENEEERDLWLKELSARVAAVTNNKQP